MNLPWAHVTEACARYSMNTMSAPSRRVDLAADSTAWRGIAFTFAFTFVVEFLKSNLSRNAPKEFMDFSSFSLSAMALVNKLDTQIHVARLQLSF